ncbi:MAG: nucleotide exchange factor GrpE [Lentisphaerae bacterium]|nr:nucleotide exchange factor GrpE [Lentisphaerota bacterium]
MAKGKKDQKTEQQDAEANAAASEAATTGTEIQESDVIVEPESTRLLRLQADFDNFKKRTIRERNETYRRANEDLMEEMLPVMDHLELALEAAAQHNADHAMVEGFRLVSDQLCSVLGKFGLTPIDATAAEFDPNLHEAISHLPSPDVAENHVMVMTRRGYKLGDMLLRAAQVVVSSGDPSAVAEATATEEDTSTEVEA